MFLVVVDAHSKWLDVIPVSTANSNNTIHKPRKLFGTHMVSLMSPFLTMVQLSQAQNFQSSWPRMELKTLRQHLITLWQMDWLKMLKTAMKKSASEGNIDARLARFLFHYRTTNSTTVVSPAELLMGRKLKTHLDKLCANLASFVYGRQQSQAMSHDKQTSERTFYLNDPVFIKHYHLGYLEKF